MAAFSVVAKALIPLYKHFTGSRPNRPISWKDVGAHCKAKYGSGKLRVRVGSCEGFLSAMVIGQTTELPNQMAASFITPALLILKSPPLVSPVHTKLMLDLNNMQYSFTNNGEEKAGCRVETKQKWLPDVPVNISACIRKVKCDETRPSCQKCTSTGRKCDGYESRSTSPTSRSSARQLLPLASKTELPPALLTRGITCVYVRMNGYEQNAFDYFRSEGAHVLWRISPAKGWVQLALQLSLDEPAVFYAITAFAVVHRSLRNVAHHSFAGPISSSQHEAALRQYCKATLSLQSYIKQAISHSTSIEPVLLCCTLFVCFEMMRGENASAVSHLRLGKRVAKAHSTLEQTVALRPHSSRATDELVAFFDKVGYDVLISQQYERGVYSDARQGLEQPLIHLPSTFESLREAKWHLESIIKDTNDLHAELLQLADGQVAAQGPELDSTAAASCYAQCLSRTVDIPDRCNMLDRLHQLAQRHDWWLASMDGLGNPQGEDISRQLMLMRIQHFYSKMNLKTCRETRESIWDCFVDDFVKILDLAERFLDDLREMVQGDPRHHLPGSEPQRSFSLDLGVLPAIFMVCLKCRSSRMRQRAMALLFLARRRESMLWSPAMALFAATIVKLEEERARLLEGVTSKADGLEMDDIPEAARFVDVIIAGETPSSLRVVCGRFVHESQGELELLEYSRTDPTALLDVLHEPFDRVATAHHMGFLRKIKIPQTPKSEVCRDGSRTA